MGDRVDVGDDRAAGLPAPEEAHVGRPDVLLPGLPRHVRSADHTVDDQLGRETISPRSAHEQGTAPAFACPPAVAVAVASGNPIETGAVVVWHVVDTAAAHAPRLRARDREGDASPPASGGDPIRSQDNGPRRGRARTDAALAACRLGAGRARPRAQSNHGREPHGRALRGPFTHAGHQHGLALHLSVGPMAERKRSLLRLDPRLFEALRRWADDDLRSINVQIEYLLSDQARRAGRLPHKRSSPRAAQSTRRGRIGPHQPPTWSRASGRHCPHRPTTLSRENDDCQALHARRPRKSGRAAAPASPRRGKANLAADRMTAPESSMSAASVARAGGLHRQGRTPGPGDRKSSVSRPAGPARGSLGGPCRA